MKPSKTEDVKVQNLNKTERSTAVKGMSETLPQNVGTD